MPRTKRPGCGKKTKVAAADSPRARREVPSNAAPGSPKLPPQMAPRPASRPVVPLQEPVPPNMTPTLHFSRAEFAARVDRTRRAMEKRGIDALIVSDQIGRGPGRERVCRYL